MTPGRIGLSFDDGPSRWTAPVLELLAAHDARATFFVIGSVAVQHPDLVRRISAEGHELGNHSWSHPALARDCDDQKVHDELLRTSDLLEELLGVRPTLFRAPAYGCDDRVSAIAERLGMRHAHGDVTPPDWLAQVRSPIITTMVLRLVTPEAIIGLHDGVPPSEVTGDETRQATVDAVAAFLPVLASRQMSCVTVSEIIGGSRAASPTAQPAG